jgi:exopolyphosphatase/guanosine-5'-triphosphate,3'-diphosphate pyrophosphatase
MRWAVYDIGSNSVKLLVADSNTRAWNVVLEKSMVTRLGRDVQSAGQLSQAAMADTYAGLRALKALAEQYGAQKAVAVATSAVRDSLNRKQFLKEAGKIIGVNVRLLSGREEAQTVFTGATTGLCKTQETIVFDVGGGSVEWTTGTPGNIRNWASLPLGCVRLTERFITGYPVGEQTAQAMRQTLAKQLVAPLAKFINSKAVLIATGGTASTLLCIARAMKRFSPQKIDGERLTLSQMEKVYHKLAALDLPELRQLPGLMPARAEVIAAGAALTLACLETLGKKEMQVSLKGLRYGILQGLAAKPVRWRQREE